ITGLAIVSSNTFTSSFVTALWVTIFILLVIIEIIEIIRAILRVKRYGWNKGLCNYHISQWSRYFTFGMFYTFTLFIHSNPSYLVPIRLQVFQDRFQSFWAWVVMIALLAQISLYVKSRLEKSTLSDKIPTKV